MRVDILGVGVDDLSLADALKKTKERVRKGLPTAVYTPNPIMISRAMHDPPLRQVLNRAAISLPDGVGLLWAAKLLSRPLSHRVAGVDFGQALLAYAAKNGYRVFLLGGKAGVAEKAASKLARTYPGLTICGTHHGYFPEVGSAAIVRGIEQARTDILLVCLGSPRQELWIDAHHPRGVSVSVALGGSLDVWAGNITRAPRILSEAGLEWLWRMILEPRRAAGLVPIVRFLAAATVEGVRRRIVDFGLREC